MRHRFAVDPEDFVNVEASATPGRWNVKLWPANEGESIVIDSHRTKAAADGQAGAISAVFVSWILSLDHEVVER